MKGYGLSVCLIFLLVVYFLFVFFFIYSFSCLFSHTFVYFFHSFFYSFISLHIHLLFTSFLLFFPLYIWKQYDILFINTYSIRISHIHSNQSEFFTITSNNYSYHFASGDLQHPDDKFLNSSIQVFPHNNHITYNTTSSFTPRSDGYFLIGQYGSFEDL